MVRAKNFTELDRLSIVVHLIDQDCQVVPLGAYRMIPTHELIRNPDFRGLSIPDAKKLSNYAHLRAPHNADKQMLIGKVWVRQSATRPLRETTFWTRWMRMQSRGAGRCKLTNLDAK